MARGPRRKLSPAQVAELRRRYATSRLSYAQLAPVYGVSPSSIANYLRGLRRTTQAEQAAQNVMPEVAAAPEAQRRVRILSDAICCSSPTCFMKGAALAFSMGPASGEERAWLKGFVEPNSAREEHL